MKVIILAAGLGSRLNSFYDTPKSMIDIGSGNTIMKNMLDYCTKDNFIERITVVTGYKRESIIELIENNYSNILIINNSQYDNTSNAISLRLGLLKANVTAEDEVLIIDADTYISKDAFDEIMTYVKNSKDIGRSTIFTTRRKRSLGEWGIVSNEFNFITSIFDIDEENEDSIPVTSGISYFSGLGLKLLLSNLPIVGNNKSSYWDDIYRKNFRLMSLKSHELLGFLYEIDYIEDVEYLKSYNRIL